MATPGYPGEEYYMSRSTDESRSTDAKVRKPYMLEVCLLLACFLAIAFSFTSIFDLSIQLALFIALFMAILLGLRLGYSYDNLQEALKDGIHNGLEAVLILISVGALIGTWIAGGVVPSIIYYGLEFIHPSIFLLATVLLCALTSLATGTSWGTAGTAGIAMVGVGEGLGIPLPLVVARYYRGPTSATSCHRFPTAPYSRRPCPGSISSSTSSRCCT